MKTSNHFILIILLFINFNCFLIPKTISQNKEDHITLELLLQDTTKQKNARFEHILRNELTHLINGNSNGLLGSYVGLSIKDKTLDFSFNKVVNRNIFEINGSGAINDNIAGILSENKFKSDIEIGFKYHKIFGIKGLSINDTEFEMNKSDYNSLENNNKLKIIKNTNNIDEAKLNVEIKAKEEKSAEKKHHKMLASEMNASIDDELNQEFNNEKKIIQNEIILLKAKINDFNSHKEAQLVIFKNNRDRVDNTDPYKDNIYLIDSLKLIKELYQIQKSLTTKNKELIDIDKKINDNLVTEATIEKAQNDVELAKINLKIAKDTYNYTQNYELSKANDTYNEEYKKILEKVSKFRANDIHLSWISFSGSISNQTYKIFDRTKMPENQILKEQDLIPSIGFSFSSYKNEDKRHFLFPFRDRKIVLFVIGAELKFDNNITALKQIEIQTVDTVAENRIIIDSQKAFEGAFKKSIQTGQIFVDYYNVGWTNQNLGLHLRATLDLGPFTPVYSARAGLVFSAKKKDDIKSNVNFEVFLGLEDLFKKDGENELFLRNSVGIQTTVPFNF